MFTILDSDESENDMLVDKPSKKKNMQQTNPNKKCMMPSTSHEFSMYIIYLLYFIFGL